jgi:DNA-directed RNA polymerase subunit beta
MQPESPVIGTGLEGRVAQDSRVLMAAEGDGVVEYVDANEIVIRYSKTEKEQFVSFDSAVKKYQLPNSKRQTRIL